MSLTLKQLNELKSLYVERIVDNMSTKDLVNYVMDDMTDYVQKLGEHEFIDEAKNYFDDGYKEVVEEVKEIHPVAGEFA
tara:strand:- start:787 stop:1023 length:237 start_codon:yes stop_codon:yes gene_type:complete